MFFKRKQRLEITIQFKAVMLDPGVATPLFSLVVQAPNGGFLNWGTQIIQVIGP
jgi:hypothetical protein